MDYTIIDAHAHLWLRQDTVVDDLPIRTLDNGRSLFMGEIRQMVPPFMVDGVNSAEVFLSNMDYAQVSAAVITQEFIDGIHIAIQNGQDPDISYKTLVMVGKSKNYYVFVLPIAEEVDMKKAAKSVGEKSVEMIHVKDINSITGYIRGGCTPLGMKKQFPTVVDSSAEKYDKIIISGGRIGSQIILNPQDLVKVVRGKFDNIVAQHQEA